MQLSLEGVADNYFLLLILIMVLLANWSSVISFSLEDNFLFSSSRREILLSASLSFFLILHIPKITVVITLVFCYRSPPRPWGTFISGISNWICIAETGTWPRCLGSSLMSFCCTWLVSPATPPQKNSPLGSLYQPDYLFDTEIAARHFHPSLRLSRTSWRSPRSRNNPHSSSRYIWDCGRLSSGRFVCPSSA